MSALQHDQCKSEQLGGPQNSYLFLYLVTYGKNKQKEIQDMNSNVQCLVANYLDFLALHCTYHTSGAL